MMTPEARVTVGPFSTGADRTVGAKEHSNSALLKDEAMCNAIVEVGDD